jgi:hypothetical protein
MSQDTSTATPLSIAVHDKYRLLIEAPGHTDSSFLGNNRKKNDRSRKTSLLNAHINNHGPGSEGCAECILFPGIVNSALTQKTDKPTADTVPRSLISVANEEDMATLAARTEWLEAELKEARRIAAKKKPKKKRNPRRKYDKEGPPSTTLRDWVLAAPNDELFEFLMRNGHSGWFFQQLSVEGEEICVGAEVEDGHGWKHHSVRLGGRVTGG